MAPKIRRLSTAIFAGGMVAGAPLIAACSSGPSYEDWAATDGAAGRINLDDVQEAFKSSQSATEFEQRVNEIYEGDGIIIIRASQDGDRLTLEGWEDLNGNNDIDDSEDDRLFSIVNENEQYDMRGHGANGYYQSSFGGFGGSGFLFGYLLASSFNRGPYFYHTPVNYGPTIRQQRTNYRQSSRYGTQVARNSRYTTTQRGFAGSRYRDAGRSTSSARQSYQQTQRSSGAFRSSNAIGRSSSFGSGFSSRSTGGFSGGGGQVRLRGGRGSTSSP